MTRILQVHWNGLVFDGRGDSGYKVTGLTGWDERPDVRHETQERPGAHGDFDARVWARGRTILVQGSCGSSSQRDALLAALDARMGFAADLADLTITHAGRTLSTQARLVRFAANPEPGMWHPVPDPDVGGFRWQAQWRCPDPFRYGLPVTRSTGFGIDRSGMEFDLFTRPGGGDEGAWRFWNLNQGSRTVLIRPMIAEGEYTGPYFDGDTPDVPEVPGGWQPVTDPGVVAAGEAYAHAGSDTGFIEFSDPGDETGTITLVNPGTADAYPTHRVTGPVGAAGFEIVTSGRTIRYGRGIPSGSVLTVDTGAGTAELDGMDASRFLVLREWTPVPPGGQVDVRFRPVEGVSSAQLTTTVRPTWW